MNIRCFFSRRRQKIYRNISCYTIVILPVEKLIFIHLLESADYGARPRLLCRFLYGTPSEGILMTCETRTANIYCLAKCEFQSGKFEGLNCDSSEAVCLQDLHLLPSEQYFKWPLGGVTKVAYERAQQSRTFLSSILPGQPETRTSVHASSCTVLCLDVSLHTRTSIFY